MKRQCNFNNVQKESLHKRRSTSPSDGNTSNHNSVLHSSPEKNNLRSSISSRLQMLLEAAINYNHIKKESDHETLILNENQSLFCTTHDFVLSANSKINELIRKHNQKGDLNSATNVEKMPSLNEREKENLFLKNSVNTDSEAVSIDSTDSSLQLQITSKLHSILVKNSVKAGSEAVSIDSTGCPLQPQITSRLHSILLKNQGSDCFPFTLSKKHLTSSDNVFFEKERLHSPSVSDFLNNVQNKLKQSIAKETSSEAKCSKTLSQGINENYQLKISKSLHENLVDVSHQNLNQSESHMKNVLLSINELKGESSNQVHSTNHVGYKKQMRETSQNVLHALTVKSSEDITQNSTECGKGVTQDYNSKVYEMSLHYDVDLNKEVNSEIIIIENESQKTIPDVIDLSSDDEDEVTVLENLYVCSKCQKFFGARSLLKFHMQMHNVGSLTALDFG